MEGLVHVVIEEVHLAGEAGRAGGPALSLLHRDLGHVFYTKKLWFVPLQMQIKARQRNLKTRLKNVLKSSQWTLYLSKKNLNNNQVL